MQYGVQGSAEGVKALIRISGGSGVRDHPLIGTELHKTNFSKLHFFVCCDDFQGFILIFCCDNFSKVSYSFFAVTTFPKLHILLCISTILID